MALKQPAKKPLHAASGFLRRAFRKAVVGLGLIMVVGNCSVASRAANSDTTPAKETPNDCVKEPGGLKFVFEPASRPVILGEQTKGIFLNDANVIPLRWQGMVGRTLMLMNNPENQESVRLWMSTHLDHLKGKSVAEQAKAVDGLADEKTEYTADKMKYVKPADDYWSSFVETIASGKGDCEDFAILKYYALRYLGVPAEKMYVILVETPGGTPGNHATLAVDINEEAGKPPHYVILNNDHSTDGRLMENSDLKYKLYYAANENGVWSIPANSVPVWGSPPSAPAVCLPKPTRD